MDSQVLKERLAGAFVALITPFTPTDDVDHVALGHNAAWMLARGLDGILLLGSTGEQVHLSEFERAVVLEVGRQHIAGRPGHDRRHRLLWHAANHRRDETGWPRRGRCRPGGDAQLLPEGHETRPI